jgi:hypothetical protein
MQSLELRGSIIDISALVGIIAIIVDICKIAEERIDIKAGTEECRENRSEEIRLTTLYRLYQVAIFDPQQADLF